MAKKIIGIFLFIGSLFVFSQEKASLVYEYSYIKDSLNTQSKKIEYFQLRVLDKFSLFVSEKNIKRDSLSQSLIKNFEQKKSNSFDLTGYPLSDFKFYLLKYFSENKTHGAGHCPTSCGRILQHSSCPGRRKRVYCPYRCGESRCVGGHVTCAGAKELALLCAAVFFTF